MTGVNQFRRKSNTSKREILLALHFTSPESWSEPLASIVIAECNRACLRQSPHNSSCTKRSHMIQLVPFLSIHQVVVMEFLHPQPYNSKEEHGPQCQLFSRGHPNLPIACLLDNFTCIHKCMYII